MVEITGTLQRQAWIEKRLPPVEQLDGGLWSVPIVFPRNPMRYTLCYVMVDGGDCLVVDPGFDSDEGYDQLADALERIGPGIAGVTGVFATHYHADHLGMARRLADAAATWVGVGRLDRDALTAHGEPAAEQEADRQLYRSWGVPEERLPEVQLSLEAFQRIRHAAAVDRVFDGGDQLRVGGRILRTEATPGHTPGHLMLWDDAARLVLSGDHILPRITPNVSLAESGHPDPLRSYLESLERTVEAEDHEVLPAHEYRFKGIAARARALRAHSAERLDEVLAALVSQQDPTVYTVARNIGWSRGWDSLAGFQLRMALSETAAHIQYLSTSGLHAGVSGLPSAPEVVALQAGQRR
ncbi:Hydroxyacylglutathione hydrolase [Arthrobacter crystallopoietes BAB-32]|uniref:Hydroxyacylglutathione hydrolase n=1 Tax=Arthrobacter crystallopoietes BAB-32 TaxID=1246476 RepID=N1V3B3_9MICC|nr:MBL fold metallo-hydrolase [Arthrobacter crystallopoietes]EMY35800.1 Hydroxyacylglutathione hydrolase [Arthrobacter crystallopoietes BAB-32]